MYRIKMKRNNFLKLNFDLKVTDIKIGNTDVIFNVNNLEKISLDYEILKNYNLEKMIFFKKRLFCYISILLTFLILLLNSNTVKKIEFSNYHDEDVKLFIKNNINYGFLKTDLIDLNHQIKKNFSEYEWINVDKIGNVLFVDIKEAPNYKKVLMNDIEGDFFSTKTGIVKYFQVENGLPLIEYNQYIKKGDKVISGDLNYIINQDEDFEGIEENYVAPRGFVLAETLEKKYYEVHSNQRIEEFTGKIQSFIIPSFFGNILNDKKSSYSIYKKEENVFFNFFGIFTLKKVNYFEKNVIIVNNDESSAFQYIQNEIKFDYLNKSNHEKEEIIDIKLLSSILVDDIYRMSILIQKIEDITEFRKR